jgi:DNA-binding NarL/FixJ family response regulator
MNKGGGMAAPLHRVIVADGERFFREAILEALSEAGIACEGVESGAAALAAAGRDARLGVVILELASGGGLEALRRLRDERPALRVIALAAHAAQEEVLEALRLGACDYLAKPLHDEELVLAVRRALGAFALETRYERLRGRLRSLEAWLGELGAAARAGESALEACATEAAADLLGASKTSLMLADESTDELRVVAAIGSPVAPEEMDPVGWGEGVAGYAITLDEVLAVDDVTADPRFSERPFHHRYEAGALAVAPLRDGDRPLGVLCASDRENGAPFGDDERALLGLLGHHVAALLVARARPGAEAAPTRDDTAQLAAWEERVDPDAELAREICEAQTFEVEPERLLPAALRAIARRLEASPVSLYLLDDRSGELALEAQVDADGRVDRERLPRNRGLTAAALQAGGLIATGRPQTDPRFDPAVDTPEDGGVGPLLAVPLRLRGKVLGVARAFPKDPQAASARTGEVVAAALSAAVRNVLLYRSLLESIDDVARARRESGRG